MKKQFIEKLTPEQDAAIPEWNARWMKHAFSCEPMDREASRKAVLGMYAAAGLAEPTVVFVPSPLVLCLAGPIAAGAWYLYEHPEFAAKLFGSAATYAATDAATDDATSAATDAATDDATSAATLAATDDATRAATDATKPLNAAVRFLLGCCGRYYNMWNGGNEWASWTCFLSFWRDVVGLKLPEHAKYTHYENMVLSSGPYILHPKFCMVSDRPEILRLDDQNRLHCTDGPAKRYRDGWSLWSVGGVKVDEQIVMRPETQTLQQIRTEQNEEVKRIRISRFAGLGTDDSDGWIKYLSETGAHRLDSRTNDIEGTREILYGYEGGRVLICHCPSTARRYALEVPLETHDCRGAQRWLSGGLSERTISAA